DALPIYFCTLWCDGLRLTPSDVGIAPGIRRNRRHIPRARVVHAGHRLPVPTGGKLTLGGISDRRSRVPDEVQRALVACRGRGHPDDVEIPARVDGDRGLGRIARQDEGAVR